MALEFGSFIFLESSTHDTWYYVFFKTKVYLGSIASMHSNN